MIRDGHFSVWRMPIIKLYINAKLDGMQNINAREATFNRVPYGYGTRGAGANVQRAR